MKAPSKKAKKSTTRPASKVYHIHPSSFRELVQELTGNGFEHVTEPPPTASNSRLQKFAPPRLGPPEIIPAAERLNVGLIPMSPGPNPFSPGTAFPPLDWTWADNNSASPISLAYRQLAESLVEQVGMRSQEEKPAAFPLSPTFGWESKRNPWDLNSNSPSSMYHPQRSLSPRWGNLSPTTLGLGSPGSFEGFDLGTI